MFSISITFRKSTRNIAMHAVEIRRFGEGVSGPMLQMRTWFDHHRIQHALIQFSFRPGKEIRFQLTFHAANEAAAFAQAFEGEVLPGSDAGQVAASAQADRRAEPIAGTEEGVTALSETEARHV